MDDALTVQILLLFCASKIASPSLYFLKFKFLLIVNFILSTPVYSPDAIMIISLLLLLIIAWFNVLNAVSLVFPSPLESILPLTYQILFPAVNTSSLDTFNVLFSNSLLSTLLSTDNILFSRLPDSSIDSMSVPLLSTALADETNTSKISNVDKITSEYFFSFMYFFSHLKSIRIKMFYTLQTILKVTVFWIKHLYG